MHRHDGVTDNDPSTRPRRSAARERQKRLALRRRRSRALLALAAVVACVGLALGLAFGLAGSSPSRPRTQVVTERAWKAWSARVRPALAALDRDYVRTGADLSKNNETAGRSDLRRLAADALLLRRLADFADPALDHDLSALARSVSSIATIGLAHWPRLDLAKFQAAVARFTRTSTTFVHAFTAEAGVLSRSKHP